MPKLLPDQSVHASPVFMDMSVRHQGASGMPLSTFLN